MELSLWMAVALVCVIEGLFPLLAPARWRQVFAALLQLSDGQLRFYGLCAVLVGVVGMWLLG